MKKTVLCLVFFGMIAQAQAVSVCVVDRWEIDCDSEASREKVQTTSVEGKQYRGGKYEILRQSKSLKNLLDQGYKIVSTVDGPIWTLVKE